MEFIEEIFIGESIQDLGTIIYSLRRNIPVFQIYCICLFEEPKSRFEILSSKELFSNKNRKRKYVIAGIAGGKHEAENLFLFMVETALQAGRDISNPLELIG